MYYTVTRTFGMLSRRAVAFSSHDLISGWGGGRTICRCNLLSLFSVSFPLSCRETQACEYAFTLIIKECTNKVSNRRLHQLINFRCFGLLSETICVQGQSSRMNRQSKYSVNESPQIQTWCYHPKLLLTWKILCSFKFKTTSAKCYYYSVKWTHRYIMYRRLHHNRIMTMGYELLFFVIKPWISWHPLLLHRGHRHPHLWVRLWELFAETYKTDVG